MAGFNSSGNSNAVQIQSVPVSSTTPTTGQVLEYVGGQWVPTTGGGGGITALTGDVVASGSGSVPATVDAIQGVAQTVATATLLSQSNSATIRTLITGNATLNPSEFSLITGSTAGVTYTLPGSTTQTSTVNSVINNSNVDVTIQAGTGTTLNTFGVVGSITLYPGESYQYVLISSVWYCVDTNAGYTQIGPSAAQQALAMGGSSNVAETIPRWAVSGVQTYTIPRFQAVYMYAGQVVNSVKFSTSSTAGSALTNEWAGLFNASGLCVAIGSQSLTTMAANTLFTWPLSAAYTVPTSGLYYVGIGIYGTTSPVYPTLAGSSSGTQVSVVGVSPILQYQTGSAATTPVVGTTTFTPVATGSPALYASLQ